MDRVTMYRGGCYMVRVVKESDLQKAQIIWCEKNLKPDVVYWAACNERKAKPWHIQALKLIGMRVGVSDLIFVWRDNQGLLMNLYIENKRPTTYKIGKRGNDVIDKRGGVQSEEQKLFQADVEAIGCDYHLIDNLMDFIYLMRENGLEKGK